MRSATSKRTWSLPAAVQPCAMVSVPRLARHARDGLRLHDALGADAQRIELAAPHVAHDEEAQHLLEVVRARIDLVMLDGPERAGALARACWRRRRIDATGVHGHGDDGAAVLLCATHGTRKEVSRPPE